MKEVKKKLFEFWWLTWIQKEGFYKTVSHKELLTINNNKSVFSESKMGQTKHKPLMARDFLRFFVKNCGLHSDIKK